MAYISGIDREQVNIVMTSLDQLIDEDNPVRVIDAYVDSLDLKVLGFIEYDGSHKGQAPYRRKDLLKLHIYGYLNKMRASRRLEAEARRNWELMWLVNGITPDHGTIAGFVTQNKEAFRKVLRNLTLILKGWGLIDGKLIAIDGTKIRAQNSKHNCLTQSGLEKKIAYAEEQIAAYLAAIEREEEPDDRLKEKLEAYQELKKKYEFQKEELRNEGLEQKTLTDPDSRRMKNNGSLDICYNVQSVVDGKCHFVVDAVATNDINDQSQLSPMALSAKQLLAPEEMAVLVDTGYFNGPMIKECVDAELNVYIKKARANNKTKENEYRKEKFVYLPEQDAYQCPAGKLLPFFERTTKNGEKYLKYKCQGCENCPQKSKCTTAATGRCIQRWEHESVLEEIAAKTAAHPEIYKQRRCIVEHPFGTVKRHQGYTYFNRKGIENVNAESASMFIAYNLKRLFGMLKTQELIKKFQTSRV